MDILGSVEDDKSGPMVVGLPICAEIFNTVPAT
jgi:hypothetical protein